MNKGRFIVIEGLEGAGKSSVMAVITNLLAENNINFKAVREPGGTEIAEKIRQIIKTGHTERLYDKTELLLMFAARVQLIQSVIMPRLEAGDWIIADRFVWSTYAYQGWGRGLDKGVIDTLAAFCLEDVRPDLILYLDIAPDAGLQRAAQRSAKDRIEQESLPFFEKIQEGYHQLLKENPESVWIDASQDMDTVGQQICQTIRDRLL